MKSKSLLQQGTVLEDGDRHAVLKERFRSLVQIWQSETKFCSTAYEMAMHPAYQQIIGMGPVAIPLILHELKTEPDHWFWALRAITGEDPMPESAQGCLDKMTDAWLQWGRQHGYEC